MQKKKDEITQYFFKWQTIFFIHSKKEKWEHDENHEDTGGRSAQGILG